MTKEERHALIMDRLAKQGSIMVSDLVRAMNVSSVTIRKDLTELDVLYGVRPYGMSRNWFPVSCR